MTMLAVSAAAQTSRIDPSHWTSRLLTNPIVPKGSRLLWWLPGGFTIHFHRHRNTDAFNTDKAEAIHLAYDMAPSRLLAPFGLGIPDRDFQIKQIGRYRVKLRALPFPGPHNPFVSMVYCQILAVRGTVRPVVQFELDSFLPVPSAGRVVWSMVRKFAASNP